MINQIAKSGEKQFYCKSTEHIDKI